MLKEKTYESGLAPNFVRLTAIALPLCAFMIWRGVLQLRHASEPFDKAAGMLPLSIGFLAILMIASIALGCFGKEIILNPASVTYRKGSHKKTFLWRDIRELTVYSFPARVFPVYRLATVGNGKETFQFSDIMFSDFPFLLDVMRKAKESVKDAKFQV